MKNKKLTLEKWLSSPERGEEGKKRVIIMKERKRKCEI